MTQFLDTEHANNAYRRALKQYNEDGDKCNRIQAILKDNATVMPMDIEWLCNIAKEGIDAQESSWYDHG